MEKIHAWIKSDKSNSYFT